MDVVPNFFKIISLIIDIIKQTAWESNNLHLPSLVLD